MSSWPHDEALAPMAATTIRAPSRWPRHLGDTLAWAASAAAALLIWRALGRPPGAVCEAGCAALEGAVGAKLLGVPILACALGLHVALWLTLTVRRLAPRPRHLDLIAFALAGALLLGTAIYLVLGLSQGLVCPLCLTLHGLALLASLGVFLSGLGEPLLSPGPRLSTLVLALAPLLAGITAASLGAARAGHADAQHRRTDAVLGEVCQAETCPLAASLRATDRPNASVVLARSNNGPALVVWLDLACAACRREFAAMRDLMARLVTTREAGLELVLRADAAACDPRASGGDPAACEAPTALLCAARVGGGPSALAYLDWELLASPGFYTRADRAAWLAGRVDPEAARCFDAELLAGPRGELSRHADEAARLRDHMRDRPGCDVANAGAPWWCFSATPSFAVVAPPRAPRRGTSGTTRELALGGLSGAARARLIAGCLEGR